MNGIVTKWTVEIHLGDLEGRTHSRASLITGLEPPMPATGDARLSENDSVDVPEIGYELATARAPRALSDLLMQTAEKDLEAVAGPGGGNRRSENGPRGW